MSEKKREIKIPRLWVYVSAFATGVLVTSLMALCFGAEEAIEFFTQTLIFGVVFIASSNVFEKIDRQPYRLTWKYWTLIGLVVLSDFLFLFLAKAPTPEDGKLRLGIFVASLVATVCFAYYTYKPEQMEISEKVKKVIATYLEENAGKTNDEIADGIFQFVYAPQRKKKTEEGEEANE